MSISTLRRRLPSGRRGLVVVFCALACCIACEPETPYQAQLRACGEPEGGWQPHTYYRLMVDLNSTLGDDEACFAPDAPLVTLDGNEHEIRRRVDPRDPSTAGVAIRLDRPENVVVTNFRISEFTTGVSIVGAGATENGARVTGTTFGYNRTSVGLANAAGARIEGNTFHVTGLRISTGVNVVRSARIVVADNNLDGLLLGVNMADTTEGWIERNTMEASDRGLQVTGGSVSVVENRLTGMAASGIVVEDVEESAELTGNIVGFDVGNGQSAVRVTASAHVLARRNEIRVNNPRGVTGYNALLLDRTNDSWIQDNVITDNAGTNGLVLRSSSRNTITGNHLHRNMTGLNGAADPATAGRSEQNVILGNEACGNARFDVVCYNLHDVAPGSAGNVFGSLAQCRAAPVSDPNWPVADQHFSACPR